MKTHKAVYILKFAVLLFVFGIVLGSIIYLSYKPSLTFFFDEFKSTIFTSHNNVFLIDIGIITLIFIASITIIGMPLIVFYIFYEGLSLGYTLVAFFTYNSFKGVLFYILFFIIIKLIYIILVLYFSVISIKFSKEFLKNLVQKNKSEVFHNLYLHFLRYVIVLGATLVNSTFIYFFSNKLLTLISALLEV